LKSKVKKLKRQQMDVHLHGRTGGIIEFLVNTGYVAVAG
jgi:hypothetical protein